MQNTIFKYLVLTLTMIVFHSCSNEPQFLFRTLASSQTNIDFINSIYETEDLNILNFHYIYNGGGVGIGDFNNDGLQDLVFTGNQVVSRLYLNKGGIRFEDVTEESGFDSHGWSTGVSVVDVNQDGWLDIYISTGGFECNGDCKNQLFINQKDEQISFVESAELYGLEDGLYTQQSAFFDYDQDGDLDVYLLHNAIDKRDKNAPTVKSTISEQSKDKLLENRDGKFIDVSQEMGIDIRGYGLGITITDFNGDMLPDLYIANDFLSDDVMYINQGTKDGNHNGFIDRSHDLLKHTSYNSMGVDIADINNDGEQDIFVLDMMPEYNERQKTMLGFMNYNKFKHSLKREYNAQFVRNTLQLGNGKLNDKIIPYSEVGHMAELYKTDWSWCPLMADFDNDGDKDIFVTNGYGKDITDLDFINYTNQNTSAFGTPKSRQDDLFKEVEKMKSVKMPNYIFENEGELKFSKRNNQWMESEESISNGAAYADLDNDGDLDLVVNNIDQPVFVMENTTNTENKTVANNWLGICDLPQGSKVLTWKNQHYIQETTKGYLSSVTNCMLIGLDTSSTASIDVIFPDGQSTNYNINEVNRYVSIHDLEKGLDFDEEIEQEGYKIQLISDDEIHEENKYQDFNNQPLLLTQHSRQGPCIVSANIDGRPGDEYFIGGSKGTAGQIVYPNENKEKRIYLPNADQEDTDAVFFDFDGDGDLDLYVVTGGVEGFKEDSYQDRLYINNDIDLFVGGRVSPGIYPKAPESKLLINQEDKLIDLTDKQTKNLSNVGMVTDALWTDMDGDQDLDLLVVGEWMSVSYFINNNGQLDKMKTIPNSSGLWNSISKADIDDDGDEDYILGNHGWNSKLKASPKEPMFMYKGDFDKNNSQDPIIGQYSIDIEGNRKLFPLHSRDDVIGQIVKVKNRYKRYDEFGKATLSEILETEINDSSFLKIDNLASSFLVNMGDGKYELKDMPGMTQISPIQDVLVIEKNSKVEDNLVKNPKKYITLYLVGNDYTREKTNGWIDASNGLVMKHIGRGKYHIDKTDKSGFLVSGDARDIVKLEDKRGKEYILVGQNNGPFLKFKR